MTQTHRVVNTSSGGSRYRLRSGLEVSKPQPRLHAHRHMEVIQLTLVARRLLGETRVVEDIPVVRQHAHGTAVTAVLDDVTIATLRRHGGALSHVTRGTVLRDLDAIPSGRRSVRGGSDFPGGQEQQRYEPDKETGRHA